MPYPYQWVISQIGARQHYGVPRGFESIGRLKRLYTDAWFPASFRWMLRIATPSLRAFGSRWHENIPRKKIVHYSMRTIGETLIHGAAARSDIGRQYDAYLRIGEDFDRRVANDLAGSDRIAPGQDVFFGFNTGALHSLKSMRVRGVRTVLDQIDPAKVEEDLVHAESQKWPGWQITQGRVPQAYWDHMSAEWSAADLVLVNSRWSRDALIRQGVPTGKICVVPVGYEPEGRIAPPRARKSGPLSVLWLGSVILRKGIPYLIEAARLLRHRNVNFVVAGPIGISAQALSTAPSNMTFSGRVARDDIEKTYAEADLFVLPTLSDGFGVTQLEAMSKGLPVIATANCGEVVTDGHDGFIVPAADANALAAAIARLDDDRDLLTEMSQNAVARAGQFGLAENAQQIEAAVQRWEEGSKGNASAHLDPPFAAQ